MWDMAGADRGRVGTGDAVSGDVQTAPSQAPRVTLGGKQAPSITHFQRKLIFASAKVATW